jgi:hypothetical protein
MQKIVLAVEVESKPHNFLKIIAVDNIIKKMAAECSSCRNREAGKSAARRCIRSHVDCEKENRANALDMANVYFICVNIVPSVS